MSVLPCEYRPALDFFETEECIKLVKDNFEASLASNLNLTRVSAPKFLKVGNGLQDDLAGTQTPVSFKVNFENSNVEVVHSLAKWKRYALNKYNFKIGTGLYTDMDAIRAQEDVSPIHSVYVDQWDWEKIISEEGRSLDYLKHVVMMIYSSMKHVEDILHSKYRLSKRLPEEITFVHSEELEKVYPDLSPKEREYHITNTYKAVFIIGIGYDLPISKKPHDIRAFDYDDWITPTRGIRITDRPTLCHGLNGDIIVWDNVRKAPLEISSMGIRVNSNSLERQARKMMIPEGQYKDQEFHKMILNDELPQTIGGGIGQSRLCMFMLQKAHIGEVQSSLWPDDVVAEFNDKGVPLLWMN